MPKLKTEKLNYNESKGEVEKVHLPRDKKGRFVSYNEEKPRSIKLVKVRGSYGSFVVKEKFIPDEIKKTLFGVALIGLLIALL
ncbi:hypothetical protein FB550_1196 [Neobacillus bataviensis]|uniref:Uncharacterized protein n=1 Tax=Neobacillus bataviensis TaxID=220685 RepID=A0A561CM91_9BACI|nr:hypothetical protein [Neobacillus bataviensis]TWD92276.1 hypothetical protein FB550_1196 [Neobacillus bataviensis]